MHPADRLAARSAPGGALVALPEAPRGNPVRVAGDLMPPSPSSAPLSLRTVLRVAIALGLPTFMVVGMIPILGASVSRILGVPIPVFWMFCCFGLITVCMAVVWFVFDRHDGDLT